VAALLSLNLGRPRPNPYKKDLATGIGKQPISHPVEVRAPGPKVSGLGSGVVGDYIGDGKHHGGDSQAVYAYAREDLDFWQRELDRDLPNGSFGENLTTTGLEVTDALLGEQWRIGREVVLQVTTPRTPCATFRGFMGLTGWMKTFTAAGRPGAYLRVVRPGTITAGDPIEILRRPDHEITIALVFRALLSDRDLMPRLLEAGDDLDPELRESALSRTMITLDSD
jgi:MOSC domain-containing protein YiiM